MEAHIIAPESGAIPTTTTPTILHVSAPARPVLLGRAVANSRAGDDVRLARAIAHKRNKLDVTNFTVSQLAAIHRVSPGRLEKALRSGNGGNGADHHRQPVEAALHKIQSLNHDDQVELVRQFGAEAMLELAAAAEKATTTNDADVADWWKELNGAARTV